MSIVFAASIGAAKKGRGGHNSKEIKLTKGAYKELLMETQTDVARRTVHSVSLVSTCASNSSMQQHTRE